MGRTEKQLADTLSARLGLTVRAGRSFLEGLLELLGEDLETSGHVELRGLGSFAVHQLPAGDSVHPTTGKPVHIPARKAVRYRASKAIKDRLNPVPESSRATEG